LEAPVHHLSGNSFLSSVECPFTSFFRSCPFI
jgi:hypothetical protein